MLSFKYFNLNMSLVRGLTTTGRKKSKIKFSSSAAKKQHEQLEKDWAQLKKKWNVSDSTKKKNTVVELPTQPKIYIRGEQDTKPKSLNSWVTGATSSKQSMMYTGNNIKGIGTMHKSNAIPVFSDQEAKDLASMRR